MKKSEFTRRDFLRTTSAAVAAGALYAATGGAEPIGYLIVIGLCGVSAALIFINLLPLLLDTSNDQTTGALTGLFVFIWQIASILGPVLVGYAIRLFASQRILFVFVSLSMMCAWLVMRRVTIEGPILEHAKRAAVVT